MVNPEIQNRYQLPVLHIIRVVSGTKQMSGRLCLCHESSNDWLTNDFRLPIVRFIDFMVYDFTSFMSPNDLETPPSYALILLSNKAVRVTTDTEIHPGPFTQNIERRGDQSKYHFSKAKATIANSPNNFYNFIIAVFGPYVKLVYPPHATKIPFRRGTQTGNLGSKRQDITLWLIWLE